MTEPVDAAGIRSLETRVGLTLKGKWRLDRLLGVGGMASVYAATHRNNKRVAVKMLHAEFSMNAAIRQRFLREGYVANSVGHPGAVCVDDDDVTEDGCAFLVMELLEGETLEARWERKGRHVEPTEVLALMDQVLETLGAAHERGIVHRDLKPENLFLTQSGQVKVLDFGIARVKELSSNGGQTQNGSVMGTPAFMPPEQARGLWDEVDAVSDLWAVGATMFALLTGRLVHVSATVNEALVLAVTQHAPLVASVNKTIPPVVAALVDRALAYDKSTRWASAREMQEALREAYAVIANKPITLLDAINDDIPAGQADLAVSAGSNRMTAMGVVVATRVGVQRVTIASISKWALPMLVGVGTLVILGIELGAPKHPNANGPLQVAVERTAVSVMPHVSPVLASDAPAQESPPVVPVERIPVAHSSAEVAVSAVLPRTKPIASHYQVQVSLSANHSNTFATNMPKAPAVPADPFAARR